VTQVFEHSARVYDLLYSFKDYEAESRDLTAVIRERNPSATSLLDVACGTGKHLELLRSEFPDVAGVDLDEGLLAVARDRLPGVVLELGDMRTFDLARTFDAVTCLFSSVGYLRDNEELTAAVGRMAEHLAPGGVLVVDGWVRPDAWWPGINVQALAETADGVAAARVARTWRDGDRTVLDMRYLIATEEGFEQQQEIHELTLFSDEAYRAAFAAASLTPEVVPSPMPDRDRYVAAAP
jgi:SAM-dependent methyltransferase